MRVLSKVAGAAEAAVSASGKNQVSPEPDSEAGASSSDAAARLINIAGSAGGAAASAAKGAAGQAASMAKDVASEQSRKAAEMMRNAREIVSDWVKIKLQKQIEKVVDRLPGLAKNALEDEYMPRWVSKGKDRVIDGMWPDARTELLWEMAVFLDRDADKEAAEIKGCDCFRAFFRYHLYPYDKSFWGKMRDPWHILFLLIPLVPVFGVNVAWFFFVFIIIDKSDAFQLVQFILAFKGTAFLSQGIVKAVLGLIMFMRCVSGRGHDSEHDCEDTGPGGGGDVWPTAAAFMFQLLLVWLAFLLLRCSKDKGRSTLKGIVDVREEGTASTKGGYIVYFLWYDLVAFCICLGIVAFAVSTRPKFHMEDWPVHHAVFGAQVLYGMLSMPFFLFTLPVLQRLLTHALPTAYDRNGACRKPIKPPKRADSKPEPIVSDAEVDDLFGRIKKAMPGGSLGM